MSIERGRQIVDTVTGQLVKAKRIAQNSSVGWWSAIANAAPLSWASWSAAAITHDLADRHPEWTSVEVLQAAIDHLNERVRQVEVDE